MNRRIAFTSIFGAVFAACGGGSPLEASLDPAEGSDPRLESEWLAFKEAATVLPDREGPAYVFGGDMIAHGEEDLRLEFERYFARGGAELEGPYARRSSHLTVDSVGGADVLLDHAYADSTGGRLDLSYCIQTGTFSANELSALVAALEAATESWSSLVNVRFRYDSSENGSCGSSNTDVFFNVRGVSASFFASAFFPDDARSARELLVDDSAFTTSAGGRDLEGIMRHETGHMLGFRHEHIWISCTGESVGDGRLVTAYDEGSVMHYPQCRTSGTGGYRQTDDDYRGAIELYGLSAALIVTAT